MCTKSSLNDKGRREQIHYYLIRVAFSPDTSVGPLLTSGGSSEIFALLRFGKHTHEDHD